MTASPPTSSASLQVLPLRDIILPNEPSFWPLAPAWWFALVIIIVMFLVLLISSYFIYKKHKKKQALRQEQAYKKARLAVVLLELKKIHQDYLKVDSYTTHHFAQAVSALLKRFVRHHLKATQAASLQDQQWINYLSACSQIDKERLGRYVQHLKAASYDPKYELNSETIDEIMQLAQQFIEQSDYFLGQPVQSKSGQSKLKVTA